jgi:nucleoside 2-deoxyribosyltransferase
MSGVFSSICFALIVLGGTDAASAKDGPRPCTNAQTGTTMKVYVASPLGFSEVGRLFYNDKLLPLLKGSGCEVLDPWTLTPESEIKPVQNMPYGPARKIAWQKLNAVIGANNESAIRRADMVFAVLDGVDVDSGTAAEIGCGFALGKKILGYRGDFRLAADNDGAVVNLQVEYFIRASGGDIVTSLDAVPDAIKKLVSLRAK